MKDPQSKNDSGYSEIDVWDYAWVIIKRRWMIIRNFLVVSVMVAVVSLFLPKTYTAVTTLLPPEESTDTGLWSMLSSSPLANLGLSQRPSSADVFVEILKSRTVCDGVLSRQYKYKKGQATLLKILDTDSKEEGRRILFNVTAISASPEGVISIKVELNHPTLAAEVANAYVDELDRVNKEKSTSRAKNSRLYIENQLKITEKKLKEASEALAQFQEKYKAVSLEEQTKTAIEKAGEVKGKILAKEVELGVALQTMKKDNVIIVTLKKELEELRKQYDHLQYGNDISLTEQKEFYIPFSEVPGVGLELARLTREVKIQETVWELLNQQYYQAKIQEARDTPTVQVLDEAVPPEKRTKPKRKLLVLIAGFLTIVLSTFWAFMLEYFEKMSGKQGEYDKVQGIYKEIKKDIEGAKRFLQRKLKRLTGKKPL